MLFRIFIMLLIIFLIIFCIGSKDYSIQDDFIDFTVNKKRAEYIDDIFDNDIIEKDIFDMLVEKSIEEALEYSRQYKEFSDVKIYSQK